MRYTSMPPATHRSRQYGFSTIAGVAGIAAIGVVFLTLFLFSTGGGSKLPGASGTKAGDAAQTQVEDQAETAAAEPPFIRIPENSKIYGNTAYKFMFAYPDGFGDLASGKAASPILFLAESALASQKPVGTGSAFMNGPLGAYVYDKDAFKLIVSTSEAYVGPTKTGNDTTWKIVDRGSATNVSVGQAYPVKSIKSQTGVTVFDFTLNDSTQLRGRWVFESGEFFVVIAPPAVSKPGGAPLTDADIAAYRIIGNNIAKTVRTPGAVKAPADTGSAGTSNTDSADTAADAGTSDNN